MIYLDNASTTAIDGEILKTYQTLLEEYFANPSGSHRLARDVGRLQDQTRRELLELFNFSKGRVIFTSSGSEANNLALIGLYLSYKNRGNEIIISPFEHPSVEKAARYLEQNHGAVIKVAPLTREGQIDLAVFSKLLSNKTVLVSVMGVNNEVGCVIDLASIKKELTNYPKVIFHSDLTQGVGKIAITYDIVDAFSFSAHKIKGLKGSGALIIRDKYKLTPLIHGGSQEDGMRGGTSNAPVNIVLAKTVRQALKNQKDAFFHVTILAKKLIQALESNPDEFTILSTLDNPFIVNFALKRSKASVILNALENENIFIGTTSSCSVKLNEPSKSVLALTQNDDYARNALRISLSVDNTVDEIDTFIKRLFYLVTGANYGK